MGSTIQMIPVADVLFFISDEKYTRVQTAQLEALIRKPIKELVDELDPQVFWQIHRSTLVNVNAHRRRVARLSRPPDRGVKGHPEKLEVSRSYAGPVQGDVAAALAASCSRSRFKRSLGSSFAPPSCSFISAMKRLGCAGHRLAAALAPLAACSPPACCARA